MESKFIKKCKKCSTEFETHKNNREYCGSHMLKKLKGLDSLREKVRIRDNHTCQKCSKQWEEGMRRFDVHHLIPEEESNKSYVMSKDMSKLITYCHKCHLNLHTVRKKISLGLKKYHATRGVKK